MMSGIILLMIFFHYTKSMLFKTGYAFALKGTLEYISA